MTVGCFGKEVPVGGRPHGSRQVSKVVDAVEF